MLNIDERFPFFSFTFCSCLVTQVKIRKLRLSFYFFLSAWNVGGNLPTFLVAKQTSLIQVPLLGSFSINFGRSLFIRFCGLLMNYDLTNFQPVQLNIKYHNIQYWRFSYLIKSPLFSNNTNILIIICEYIICYVIKLFVGQSNKILYKI